jgi:integrase
VTGPAPVSVPRQPAASRPRPARAGAGRRREDPWEPEYGRDVWRLRVLGFDDRGYAHLRFDAIPQPWLKDLAKRWARWRLTTGLGVATARSGTMAIQRFGTFLAAPSLTVERLDQITREVLERYLACLHAELGGRTVHRNMIGQLSLFLTAIRQHRWDTTLPATAVLFPEDFPKDPQQRLPRALSEQVMAQLEHPGTLARWDNPGYLLITLILMRCGLRINDALQLPRDCIIYDADGAPYLRYLNHKMDREALVPIDEQLQQAIQAHSASLDARWPQGTPGLFPQERNNPDGRLAMGDRTYRRALKRWLTRCDIRDEHGRPSRSRRIGSGTRWAPG